MAKTKVTKSKSKKKPAEQLKIEGTGRIDAIPELEKKAEKLRVIRAERMALGVEEGEADEELTDEFAKHTEKLGGKPYKYEGGDGQMYVLKPTKVKVRVHRVPAPKAPK